MNMRILITLAIQFICLFSFAQKENNNWTISQGIGMSHNTSPPSLFPTATSTMPYSGNIFVWCTMSYATGQRMFYTDGNVVWDKNDNIMQNGIDITTTKNIGYPPGRKDSVNRTVGSTVIIPSVSNPEQYYIFATGGGHIQQPTYISGYAQVKYSIADMSLNNGSGAILPGKKNKLLSNIETFNACAAAGNGTCHKWLTYVGRYTDELLAFKIDATGIDTIPVRSPSLLSAVQIMKFSNDNNKLAISGYTTEPRGSLSGSKYPAKIVLYDFDINTGVFSNPIVIEEFKDNSAHVSISFSMEFSADNSKFYYRLIDTNINKLYQLDLSLPTHSILGSKKEIHRKPYIAHQDLLIGPDNKIYSLIDTNELLVIDHPNKKGKSCGVHSIKIPNSTLNAYPGIMHSYQNKIPVSQLTYTYNDFNICSFPAKLSSQKSNANSYIWNTGATSQNITVNQNGTYWVKAADACGAYRVDTFHIKFSPPVPINDTFACNGQQVTIPLEKDAAYTWHNNSQGATFDSTGTYYVTIDKGQCGVLKDTFFVKIYPKKDTKLLPEDTIVCNEDFTTLLSSSQDLGQYTWSTGASTRSMSATTQDTYWLTSYTPCGIYSDTIEVSFCKPQIDSLIFPPTICSGTCIDITAITSNYPKQYQWSFDGAEPTSSVSKYAYVCFYDTGIYNMTLRVSSPGGSVQKGQQIRVAPSPSIRFPDTTLSIKYKTQLTLQPCTIAEQTSWYKGDKLICNNCDTLTILAKDLRSTYKCVVKNFDCSDSCIYVVDVTDIATEVWLPSAFSPNNDGKNDHFRVITDNPNLIITNFSIYNRFGQRIYREDGISNTGWDGTFNGKAVDMGTYYWLLKYKIDGGNEEFFKKGDVMLVY